VEKNAPPETGLPHIGLVISRMMVGCILILNRKEGEILRYST